eukprot:6428559-Alexandrium_andersonii.AAC.1
MCIRDRQTAAASPTSGKRSWASSPRTSAGAVSGSRRRSSRGHCPPRAPSPGRATTSTSASTAAGSWTSSPS